MAAEPIYIVGPKDGVPLFIEASPDCHEPTATRVMRTWNREATVFVDAEHFEKAASDKQPLEAKVTRSTAPALRAAETRLIHARAMKAETSAPYELLDISEAGGLITGEFVRVTVPAGAPIHIVDHPGCVIATGNFGNFSASKVLSLHIHPNTVEEGARLDLKGIGHLAYRGLPTDGYRPFSTVDANAVREFTYFDEALQPSDITVKGSPFLHVETFNAGTLTIETEGIIEVLKTAGLQSKATDIKANEIRLGCVVGEPSLAPGVTPPGHPHGFIPDIQMRIQAGTYGSVLLENANVHVSQFGEGHETLEGAVVARGGDLHRVYSNPRSATVVDTFRGNEGADRFYELQSQVLQPSARSAQEGHGFRELPEIAMAAKSRHTADVAKLSLNSVEVGGPGLAQSANGIDF